MPTNSPYNDLLLECFGNPRHAGAAGEPDSGMNFSGQASEFPGGPRVRISCAVEEGRLTRLVFQAWGCPHFLAAAELLCRRLDGLDVSSAGSLDLAELAEQLAVPVEKTVRILTLEDAFNDLKRALGNPEISGKSN